MEMINRLRQNLSYALRGLLRAPGFAVAVVLTLGLGLGVNAAMFTFLDKVFVRAPAGVANPGEVRRLYPALVRPKEPGGRVFMGGLFYPQVLEIARHTDSTLAIGLFASGRDSISITVGANVFPVRRTIANTGYFRTLGVRPKVGRFFDASEDRIDVGAPVAVISHALWQRAFHMDPHVVGSTVRIKDMVVTIIGVTPEPFAGIDLDRSDFWMPIGNQSSGLVNSFPWYDTYEGNFSVVVRLPTRAIEDRFIQTASRAAAPVRVKFWGDSTAEVRAGPLLAALGPAQRNKEVSISLRLGGVALIVLLIAIANVSNLVLVRAVQREREIAIRRALGASRWRLFEQLFTESALLSGISGAVAVVLAVWAGSALRTLLLPEVNWSTGVVDWRTAAFAAVTALVAAVLVGLVPAIHAWRPELVESLKSGGKSGTYRRSRLRSTLLVAQAALSVVLLVGAGLFVRSLRNIQSIPLGFDVDRLVVATAYSDNGDLAAEMDAAMPAIIGRLSAIEGVEGVAAASSGPMQGMTGFQIFLPGRDSLPPIDGQRGAFHLTVSERYFTTVGQRVLAGRAFQRGDPRSIVVGEKMAKAYWPGQSAVGKCIILQSRDGPCVPVVGVAAEAHHMSVIDDRPGGFFYVNGPDPKRAVILRASASGQRAISALVAGEIKRLVPRADRVQVQSMTTFLEPQLRPWKLGATLFTIMGLLALVVASIGVYSVMAYSVSQRTNEMGIRVALGAQMADIARLVVGDGLRTITVGIVTGIALSIALSRLAASMLYDISPRDPWIMIFAALVLGLIGLVACIIPAMRASRVNPVTALRLD